MDAPGSLQVAQRPANPAGILVVGAGIIGLSIAWRLAQRGYSVSVYDQAHAASEASWAGAGMLAPGGELQSDSPLLVPALESRRLYPDFVDELRAASGRYIDFRTCGGLDLCFSSEEVEQLNARAEGQLRLGIASKPLSRERIAAFWPHAARNNIAGGRFYPDDATVDPRDINAALLTVCRALGVDIVEGSPVSDLVVTDAGIAMGQRTFAAAVIAGGAWSSQIRINQVPPLPAVEPVRGVLVGYRQPEPTCPTIVRHRHTYLLQRSNGLLIAGSSEERIGFDRAVPAELVNQIAARAATILPHLADTTPTESWMGFRPLSDSLHVQLWHSDRLYLAYGHFRNGILLAPWTAHTIASLLTERIAAGCRT